MIQTLEPSSPQALSGVLVVDKPEGPTSHDVVTLTRRVLGVSRIGHTGTLDPLATGVLPLVIGRATRLAQFLTASDKSYEATIAFGRSTDTYDAKGRETGTSDRRPTREQLEQSGIPVFATEILERTAFREMSFHGRSPSELAPDSNAALNVRAFADEVIACLRAAGEARRAA